MQWGPAPLGLLITEITNLIAHYAGEYADVDIDSMTRRTIFSGGSGVLPSGVAPLARRGSFAADLAPLGLGRPHSPGISRTRLTGHGSRIGCYDRWLDNRRNYGLTPEATGRRFFNNVMP